MNHNLASMQQQAVVPLPVECCGTERMEDQGDISTVCCIEGTPTPLVAQLSVSTAWHTQWISQHPQLERRTHHFLHDTQQLTVAPGPLQHADEKKNIAGVLHSLTAPPPAAHRNSPLRQHAALAEWTQPALMDPICIPPTRDACNTTDTLTRVPQVGGGRPSDTQTQQGTYIPPGDVGLYAENQVGLHCGASALNCMLGRAAIKGPGYIAGYLSSEGIPPRGWDLTPTDTPYYTPQGNYDFKSMLHWLYEHTVQAAMLAAVKMVPSRPQPDPNQTMYTFLADLPQGCTQFVVLDAFLYGGHWYTIAQSPLDQQWYNLDSVIYSSTGGLCKRMEDSDWHALVGVHIYCLFAADAYTHGGTICNPNIQQKASTSPTSFPLVHGSQVVVSETCTRRAPRPHERPAQPSTATGCQRKAQTQHRHKQDQQGTSEQDTASPQPPCPNTRPGHPITLETRQGTDKHEPLHTAGQAHANLESNKPPSKPPKQAPNKPGRKRKDNIKTRLIPVPAAFHPKIKSQAQTKLEAPQAPHTYLSPHPSHTSDPTPILTDATSPAALPKIGNHGVSNELHGVIVKKEYRNPTTGRYQYYYGVAKYMPCAKPPHVYQILFSDGDREKMMIGETRDHVIAPATVPDHERPGLLATFARLGIQPPMSLHESAPLPPQPDPPPKPRAVPAKRPANSETNYYADIRSFFQTTQKAPLQAPEPQVELRPAPGATTAVPAPAPAPMPQEPSPKHNTTDEPAAPQHTQDGPTVTSNIQADTPMYVATWNACGLYSSRADLTYILSKYAEEHQEIPHILVLTEIKQRRVHNWMRQQLKEYQMFASLVNSHQTPQVLRKHKKQQKKRSKAGVIIALRKDWMMLGKAEATHLPADTAGYMAQVKIQMCNSDPLTVVGMYCPHDVEARRRLYSAFAEVNPAANRDKTPPIVVAGDFNATWRDNDRASGHRSTADALHRAFMQQHKLNPVDGTQPHRAYTFRKATTVYCSRIDDVYTNLPLPDTCLVSTVPMAGRTSDHDPLHACIPFTALNQFPPLPQLLATADPQRRLLSLTDADRQAAQKQIQEEKGQQYADLNQRMSELVDTYVRPHWDSIENQSADVPRTLIRLGEADARATVEALGTELATLLLDCQEIMLDVCPTRPVNVTGSHYRPRQEAKKRRQFVNYIKAAARLIYRLTVGALVKQPTEAQQAHEQKVLAMAEAEQADNPELSTEEALRVTKSKLCKQRNRIDKEHAKFSSQQQTKAFRSLMESNQKLGNKIALGKHKPNPPVALRAIQTEDGRLATTAEAIIEETTKWAEKKLRAPEPTGKTGEYLPNKAPRDYPWHRDPTLKVDGDPMQPDTPHRRQWLHPAIDDEVAFHTCLKTLAKGKAPGPDGVVNELLQILPDAGKQAIHNLFRLMWATSCTPTDWKISETAMLYKHKGSPLDLNFYRRIGLEVTIYKFWTRIVTFAMVDAAERNNMLSASQTGFRSKRSTAEQIEMMVMALEDAYWFKQDIYLMQADMTEAFDTISHDKLLCILYDLGFPTDAIEVVKDLYTNAKTKFRTPHGCTEALPIDRGTIQGDSLSPFLFVLYIEPLLRWLHSGQHGYQPGCLKDTQLPAHQRNLSSITYADDLNLLTGSLEDLKHQAAKICAYTTWGHLVINHKKTTVTGALHRSMSSNPYDDTCLKNRLSHIKVQGQAVTYQHPKLPFRHLGVLLTMDLNYKHQLRATLTHVREAAQALKACRASTAQKMRTLKSSLRAAVSHVLTVAPFSTAELKVLDGALSKIAKQAYKLSVSMATLAAHEDTSRGGLGCPSLEVEHTVISTQRLTRALNNTGPLGRLTRALMARQQQAVDQLSATHLPHVTRYAMRLRQTVAMTGANVLMKKNGAEQITMNTLAPLALGLAGIATEPSQWDSRLVADIHTLHSAGILNIETMLHPDRTRVLQSDALHNLLGKRHTKPSHQSAWRRVAHYLAHAKPWEGPTAPPAMPTAGLPLHAQFAENLRTTWPPNKTAWNTRADGVLTNLHTLAGLHENSQGRAIKARDKVAAYLEERARANQLPPQLPQRQVVPLHDTRLDRHTRTGYAQFQQAERALEAAQGKAKEKALLTLAQITDHYSHTKETVVAVKALSRSNGRPQAVVQWGPCIQPGWQVQAQRLQGYQYKLMTEATPQAITQAGLDMTRPCEYCHEPVLKDASDMQQCGTCGRWYHTHCVTTVEAVTPNVPHTCKECLSHRDDPNWPPPGLKLYKIEWNEAPEPLDIVRNSGTPEAQQQLQELQDQHKAAQDQPCKRPKLSTAGHVPPHDSERVYDVTIGQRVRQKLKLHPLPINPHADIAPALSHQEGPRAYLRRITYADADCQVTNKELYCIYGPDGRCEHMIAPAVVARLKHAFEYMQARHPGVLAAHKAGTFVEELRRLAIRYRPLPGTTACKLRHWQLPEKLKTAIMHKAKITKERFASPLSSHPCTQAYWSEHKRDQVFGANHDAYSTRWTGASMAVPPMEVHVATQALDWAIRSAKTTTDCTLTLLILPTFYADRAADADDDPRFMQLLRRNHDVCLPVCTFGWESLSVEPPGCQPLEEPHLVRQRFMLIAVGNLAGYDRHFPFVENAIATDFYQEFQWAVRDALPESTKLKFAKIGDIRLDQDTTTHDYARWARKAGRRFSKRHADSFEERTVPRHPVYTFRHQYPECATPDPNWLHPGADNLTHERIQQGHAQAVDDLRATQPAAPPLVHDWQTFMYTDGSHVQSSDCAGPGIGAAVYIPGTDPQNTNSTSISVYCAWEGDGAEAKCNTICRAELAALDVALAHHSSMMMTTDTHGQETLHIATDSLASMYGIAKMITRPQDLREHRHRLVLESLAQKVKDFPGTIHLWKVKSHTGVVGNEKADRLAVKVATGETDAGECHLYTTPSNDREKIYWPHLKQETEKDGVLITKITPLPDIQDTLKQQAHTHNKYGSAPKEGIYAQAWLNIDDQTHHASSHGFMTSRKVDPRTRKQVLQYRWGLLPTQRYLKKIGKADNLNCPLCAQEDGGHHAISGCPVLSAAVTRRHNDAGTEILEAISRGEYGAHVLLSDIGFTKRRSQQEAPVNMQRCRFLRHIEGAPKRMHHSLVTALENHQSVPDITLAQFDDNASWTFTFVEIKYCRDTDPAPQTTRAENQHRELERLIKENEPRATVTRITITLGVSGTIYNQFMQDMRTLGVTGPALTSLAKRLHFIAVRNLRQIWDQRTALLHRKAKATNRSKRSRRWHLVRSRPTQTGRKRPSTGSRAPDHRKRPRKR